MGSALPRGTAIENYVREISPDLYGAFWMRRRIVAELTDHLLETTTRFEARGLSRVQAEERAIEHFGSPSLVARNFATSKGVGVPTQFTRYSGLAGMIGVVVLSIALVWSEASEAFMHGAFAEIGVTGFALMALSLVGIYLRCRGQLGRTGRTGFQLLVAGFVIGWGSSLFWFSAGAFLGLILLLVGFLLYLKALYSADVLPRAGVVTMIAGIGAVLVIGFGSALARQDWGPIATFMACVVVGSGLIQLCWAMWRERPAEASDWESPPTVA